MKNFIVGALIIGVAIVVGFVMSNDKGLGGGGQTFTSLQFFKGGLIQGGGITTISQASTTTLTAKQVCENDIIVFAASAQYGTASTTLPTAANMTSQCLQSNGDYKDIIFYNSSVAASTTAFVANTGNTIYYPTGGNTVIAGLNLAHMRFTRYSASAVMVTIEEGIAQ